MIYESTFGIPSGIRKMYPTRGVPVGNIQVPMHREGNYRFNFYNNFLNNIRSAFAYNKGINTQPTTSTFGSIIATDNKCAGGAVGLDMNIYVAPQNLTQWLRINPYKKTIDSVGQSDATANKWSYSTLHSNGRIYAIGVLTGNVCEFDTVTQSYVTFGNFGAVQAFGIVEGINGLLYAASTVVYEINPFTKQITTFGSLDVGNRCSGWVAHPNGKLYSLISVASTNGVIELDPVARTVTTWGGSIIAGHAIGLALAPNGKIYGVPYNGTTVLEIDPYAKTLTGFGSFTSAGNNYLGCALAPNGKIYGAPAHGSTLRGIIEIDPIKRTATTFGSFAARGGMVMHPNGKMYMIPARTVTTIVELDFSPFTQNFDNETLLSPFLNKM